MNKQQTLLYTQMTPADREKLLILRRQLEELNTFRKHVYNREWFHREMVSIIAVGLTMILAVTILMLSIHFVGAWGLAALVFIPSFFLKVLKQLDKRSSWEALFYEEIQNYAPKAVVQSNIQWIKNRVQYSSRLDFKDVTEWFDKELSCIRVRSNDIEARYQYAWFYQPSKSERKTNSIECNDESESVSMESVYSSSVETPTHQNKRQEDTL